MQVTSEHSTRLFIAAAFITLTLWLSAAAVFAQERTILPLPTDPPFKGKIGLTYKDSTPSFPPILTTPAKAPNVLLILLDDVGFGNTSTFGGPIQTPTLDRLARSGLRYNNFHVAALCSPTRAALLTGRNHHVAGTAMVVETANGYPGYDEIIPKSTASIAEILRLNGYSTAAFGKWHNVPMWESSVAGPFDHWPTHMGFDYFYGFLGGMTQQYSPNTYVDTTPIEPYFNNSNYYFPTDMANRAIAWIRYQHSVAPGKPFFVYYATGSAHAPHQVPRNWIDLYKGKFNQGWNVYRDETFARQQKLGVIPAGAKLSSWPSYLPRWDSLTPDQQRLYAREMEAFAGFLTETDHEVGRVIDAIKESSQLDNTLIIYVAGDNGASPEGGIEGTLNEDSFLNGIPYPPINQQLKKLDQIGGPHVFNNYPVSWAWASNTPFKGTKQIAAYLGGVTDGMVISWPERIKDYNGVRPQFHDVIDIAPTILDVAGLPEPTMVDGVVQKPFDGISMAYTFDNPRTPSHRTTQYFEMGGNRSIYHDGWIAACFDRIPWAENNPPKPAPDIFDCKWELYNVANDYSESTDLAPDYPEKVTQLKDLFWAEAARNQVLPLDNRGLLARFVNQPSYTMGHTDFTFYSGAVRLTEHNAPNIMNKSFDIKAVVNIPPGGAQGMLVTEGGRFGGYGLFIQNGKLVFAYNFADTARYIITSDQTVPSGKVTLGFSFAYDGGIGAGGRGTLLIHGKKAGEGRIQRTEAVMFSDDETFDVGLDTGTPVTDTYQVPFWFTGTIDRIDIHLGKGTTILRQASAD